MAYSRAELLQVVCAIAGRPVDGQPGTWPEASDVVEEAAALLAEMDHRWEVYMGARSAMERPATKRPRCCEWSTVDLCGADVAGSRVDLGGTAFDLCAAHEATGEALGYWRPKAVQP